MNATDVDTEHLLLALMRDTEGVGVAVLGEIGGDLEAVIARAQQRVQESARPVSDEVCRVPKLTGAARKVLILAAEEADQKQHDYVGTEHLFLGLLREEAGKARQILEQQNIDVEIVRACLKRYLDAHPTLAERTSPKSTTSSPEFLEVLRAASKIRSESGHESVEVKDLLIAICEGQSAHLLSDAGVDVEALRIHLRA